MRIVLSVLGICTLLATGSVSICAANEIATVAGTGVRGNSPDGTPGTAAQIGEPYGVVIGPDGALYVCEISNHLVRRLDLKTGATKVVAGNGTKGFTGDGGPATSATMFEPYEVRFDSKGNMIVVEMKNAIVRKIDAKTNVISTLAGTGEPGYSGDGGPATKAQLNQPHSISLDADDNIYICDIRNSRVRKVDAKTGIISTVIGGGSQSLAGSTTTLDDLKLKGPRALDAVGEKVFILAFREGNAIYKLDLNAKSLTHLAGTGKSGYSSESTPGPQTQLSGPKGVAVAANGDIYFADTESHTIRVIRKATGNVETVAGDGKRGDGPEDDPLKCRMSRPHSVCVDAEGNVYIGDSEAHRVRVLKVKK